MIALILGGVSPDLDFLAGPLVVSVDGVHRGATHSLLFAVIVAGMLMFVPRFRGMPALWAGVGVLLHLLVDSMLDADPSNGVGVALLWPLTSDHFSPFLLPGALCQADWSNLRRMLSCIWPLLVAELPIWGLAAVTAARNWKARG